MEHMQLPLPPTKNATTFVVIREDLFQIYYLSGLVVREENLPSESRLNQKSSA